jgi:hypothetical protein
MINSKAKVIPDNTSIFPKNIIQNVFSFLFFNYYRTFKFRFNSTTENLFDVWFESLNEWSADDNIVARTIKGTKEKMCI